MRLFRAPRFWKDKDSPIAKALNPLSKIYAALSNGKMNSVSPEAVAVPVICVGNVVLGGAGKTPVASMICEELAAREHRPHVVASGYAGYVRNVVRVNRDVHTYLQVGDEALLLAKIAPTWIGRNKVHACRAAVSGGASVIVMDDGLQNNSVIKDLSILVVDSGQGFGNERLLPAGPLRETIEASIRKSDVVLIVGERNAAIEDRILSVSNDIKIYHARTEAIEKAAEDMGYVIGFCGLGYPDKFKMTLDQAGYKVLDFIVFQDHHAYTITELQRLIATAKKVNATLVTTWKDYVKIPGVFKDEVKAIEIKLRVEEDEFGTFLEEFLSRSR
ncbi:MAG: tetraacyldisaccharide 4'-kinase [Holosporales bacterium]|nr:tetraacyldisaccharide 4'-kinase [Holosporales bacterium]